MEFELQSNFEPTGDQPHAIELLANSVSAGNKHQTLLGVTGSGKTFTIANVIQKLQKPTLIISHNKTLAAQLYQEFRDFFPHNAVSYFVSYYDYYQPESYIPSTDTYIEKETDINDEIDKLRLSTTANLLSRPDTIVVASVSCIYNLGSPLEYAKNFVELIEGQVISRDSLLSRFIDMQYTRSDMELSRGSFRVRGDTVQIWPANLDNALAISMLDTTIEAIEVIDPVSAVAIPQQPASPEPDHMRARRYTIYAAKHYQSGDQDRDTVFQTIKRDLALRLAEFKAEGKIVEAYRLGQKVKHDLEMIRELGFVNGIENYSRYFDGRKPGEPPYSLLDYFSYNAQEYGNGPDDFLTIIDESHITMPQLKGMHAGDKSRKQTLIDFGFRLPSALDNRPLTISESLERLPHLVYASATPGSWELSVSGDQVAEQLIRPTGLIDPPIEVRSTKGQIADLIQEVMDRKARGERVLVTTLTKRTAEALTDYLNTEEKVAHVLGSAPEEMPRVAYLHADVHTLDRQDILDDLRTGVYDVVVGINLLREGLDLPEVTLVAILEADMQGFLRSRSSLIQTMGRAARHVDGRVIMYADKISDAMREAMDEVERRRVIQMAYNKKHGITPQTIVKPVRTKLLEREREEERVVAVAPSLKDFGWETLDDIQPDALTPKDREEAVKELTRKMRELAKAWEFEKAAAYRDMIQKLKSQ